MLKNTVARRTSVAVLAVAGLVLTACGAQTTDAASGTGSSGGTVRVSVGVDPSYSPIFLADTEGLFKKHGVDVQVIQTEGGPAPSQNVVAGTSDLAGNADSTALTVMATSSGLRALGVWQESGRYLKVVLRNGITDPHQIKTMGTIPGLGLYATVKYLESVGLSQNSVKLVNAGAPEMPSLLSKGSIDGYVLYEPWASDGLTNGGKIAETTGDYGVNYHMWIVADEKWLGAHKDQASRFFSAVTEADKIVAADPQRACRATQKEISMPMDKCLPIVKQIDFKARAFNDDDLNSAKSIEDFFASQNLIKNRPDVNTVVLKDWYTQNVSPTPR